MSDLGQLNAGMIGNSIVTVAHEGARVTGLLTGLQIDTETETSWRISGGTPHETYRVHVTVNIGPVTLGPLERSRPCEIKEVD